MLLAVEGGGFFSSSATGYSKALTLLLLGRQLQEEETTHQQKPIRVSHWNHQYQLVDREPNNKNNHPDLQLAPDRVSSGCAASFFCFSPSSLVSDNGENTRGKVYLKSSLKKHKPNGSCISIIRNTNDGILNEHEGDAGGCTTRMKVQWTDSCGKELVEIRVFEPSDVSDEENEEENETRCACTVM